MLLKFSLLFFISAYCQDIYFEKLKEKPLSQQVLMLEKRLEFAAKRKTPINEPESLKAYTNLDIPKEKKNSFLLKLVSDKENTNRSFLKIAWEHLLAPQNKTWLLSRLTGLLELQEPHIREKIIQRTIENIDRNDIDWVLANKEILKKLLMDFSKHAEANSLTSLSRALIFGFTNLANEIIDQNPTPSKKNEQWFLFYKCQKLQLDDKIKPALNCYQDEKKIPWFVFGEIFIKYILGELSESDKERYRTTSQKAPKTRTKIYTLIYEQLYDMGNNQKLKNFIATLEVSSNYWPLFILLELNKKRNFLNADEALSLQEKFIETFPDLILTKVLTEKLPPEALSEIFKNNSITYQVLKFTRAK